MMYRKYKYIFIFFICTSMHGVDIGSDTAVNRFDTQQALNNGDRVAGFAALDAGFFFTTVGISGIWDTFFQVSGNVDLSISTLILNQDLIFNNVSALTLFGNIIGQGHTVGFSSSMQCIPDPSVGNVDCRVYEFLTNMQTDEVNTLDWSILDSFLAVGLPSHGSDELLIYSWDGSMLTLQDSVNTSPEDVLTVRWHPTLPLLAVGITNAAGDELFIYSVDGSGNLTLEDSAGIGNNCNAVAWHPDGTFLVVGTQSNPELRVFPVDTSGNLGTPTTFNIANNRTVNREAIDWNATGDYVAVGIRWGGGPPGSELQVLEFNSGPGTLSLNATSGTGSARGVSWNPAAGDQDLLAVITQSTNPRLRIFRHNGGAGTLTLIDSEAENANQGRTVDWSPNGNCLTVGKDGGVSATEFKVYPFDRVLDELGAPQEFDTAGNSEVLSTRWSRDGDYVAVGLDNNDIVIYRKIRLLAGSICFIWSDVNWVLDSNIELKDTCLTFSGLSSIDGRGHCLSLNQTSSIQIQPNSSLLLQNITLKDVGDHQLGFLDASSTVSFKDVTLVLNEDYNMSVGKFDVLKTLRVEGECCAFSYESDQTSHILSNGSFIFDIGTTFSYRPPIASQTLLTMQDETSVLRLNDATLHTTSTGIQFTKGTIILDGTVAILNEGTNANEGVILGDGLFAANDVTLRKFASSGFDIQSGYLVYKNLS